MEMNSSEFTELLRNNWLIQIIVGLFFTMLLTTASILLEKILQSFPAIYKLVLGPIKKWIVIIFKLYSNNFPNIIVNNNVENIEKQILINQLKLNWPCEIENKTIYEIVENFAKDVSINKEIYTDDYMKYVGYVLISKILQLNIK